MEQEKNGQLTRIADTLQTIADSLNKDPQEVRYHAETHCPSCGRFVGTETRCPYCQAETPKRLSIKVFKVISVLLSTVGLLMLLFYARNVKTQEVKIKDLGPLYNFGHVRMIGKVTKCYGISQWGSLSFTLSQGNPESKQEIRVSAYNKVAKAIKEQNKVPSNGDLIEIEGQVRVQGQTNSLMINSSDHIKILKKGEFKVSEKHKSNESHEAKFGNPLAPQAITKALLSKPAKVLGLIKSATQLEKDCVAIELENGQEKGLTIFIPEFSKKATSLPTAGSMLEASGVVKEYNGALEIDTSKHGSFKVLPNKE